MLLRRNKCVSHKVDTCPIPNESLKKCVFRSSNVMDDLLFQKSVSRFDSDCVSVSLTDQLYLLINQKRIDSMTLRAIADNLQLPDKASSPKSSLKPDELFKYIKPRYVQSLSDLNQWQKYLADAQDYELKRLEYFRNKDKDDKKDDSDKSD